MQRKWTAPYTKLSQLKWNAQLSQKEDSSISQLVRGLVKEDWLRKTEVGKDGHLLLHLQCLEDQISTMVKERNGGWERKRSITEDYVGKSYSTPSKSKWLKYSWSSAPSQGEERKKEEINIWVL